MGNIHVRSREKVRHFPVPSLENPLLSKVPQETPSSDQDISDEEYTCTASHECDDGEISTPHLRNKPPTNFAKVHKILDNISWTIPSFPVLTIFFTKAEIEIEKKKQIALFNASDARVNLTKLPCEIEYTSFCQIELSGSPILVLWEFDLWTTPGLNNSDSESILSSGSWTTSCTTCSSEFTDDEVEEEEEHTLPFKVLGGTKVMERQKNLKSAFMLNRDSGIPFYHFKAKIEPEPENPFDENAIAVSIDYGKGWKLVGYIPKELTKYIHPLLRNDKIKKLSIGSIKYRVNFSEIGYYMSLSITRKGVWERHVISSSRCVQ